MNREPFWGSFGPQSNPKTLRDLSKLHLEMVLVAEEAMTGVRDEHLTL